MKNRNFVNLNVNPCKMCMPMGAALAFKGIENSMLLLHGSQGCSTYIRRHMATHYNEPVDIASSSLNEKGTVYGGSKNLKKGLTNVLKQYDPGLIGIATTCLAETIGEDITRIVQEFKQEDNIQDKYFIPVSTPGYGGSQFEGYFLSVRKILENLTTDSGKNEKINVIAGILTPADIRHIKEIFELFEVEYTLIPDISDTLDAPHSEEYKKIPEGGTTLNDIKIMSGAKATIEMSLLIDDVISPGTFLEEKFGVPLYRCTLPMGLENTDKFIKLISIISGKKIPEKLKKERGRMLDGMIDSHKYNSEGRAAIFGEPEIVYATAKICLENGIFPALISTGTNVSKLKILLDEEVNHFEEKSLIIDDTDFETIREYTKKLDVNILIGSSDGKFITEKDGIPLVRIGFPVHDRIGAQRQLFVGYEGSMSFLDGITNTILDLKHSNFREERYNEHYAGKRI
jgi:nitrogenase molybdenum-iron protein NifN